MTSPDRPTPQDSPKPPKYTGLTHLCKATTYSIAGLRAAFTHEAAFRHDLLLALANAVLAILFLNVTQSLVIISLSLALLATELLNSAIEAVVDLASPQRHELAGRAKDMGSAAVFCLLSAIALFWVIWLIGLLRG